MVYVVTSSLILASPTVLPGRDGIGNSSRDPNSANTFVRHSARIIRAVFITLKC